MVNPAEIAHGPILLGFTFNAILLGVMCTQIYLYYTSFKKDKLWIKIFVAVLFGLDILNTACMCAYVYEALVVHFGDFQYLGVVTWLFDTDPSVTGAVVLLVQSFFAWRIWVLTKSKIFPLIIVITAIVGGVCGIATPAKVAKAPFFSQLILAKAPIIVWLSAEVLGDLLITTILSKQKTGFQRSDMLIDRIIRSKSPSAPISCGILLTADVFAVTIQTGLVTAVFATTDLLLYLLDNTGLHLLFNISLCKLYSNSLMSTLNSRGVLMSLPAGTSSTGTRTLNDDNTNGINMPNIQGYKNPVGGPVNMMKPSEIISYNSKHTEVFVNVESQQETGHPGIRRGGAAYDLDNKRNYDVA